MATFVVDCHYVEPTNTPTVGKPPPESLEPQNPKKPKNLTTEPPEPTHHDYHLSQRNSP